MRSKLILTVLLAAGLASCGESSSDDRPVVVFAAASLQDFALEIGETFEAKHKTPITFNFAGSNTLAQQIKAAPGADVFLSADREWVTFLESEGRAREASRRKLLANQLVLIAHRDAPYTLDDPLDLATASFRHLALADPEAVPAGRYARAALQRLPVEGTDLWTAVADRVAPALDVRAALALVASDPEILGIVYRSDTLASDDVRILCELPEVPGQPILYFATRIVDSPNPRAAQRLLDFLMLASTAKTALRHGFSIPQ
ncbi:MAG: molybdate ABC transporter substrate-binding protein [Acidobacteriota bacterium]